MTLTAPQRRTIPTATARRPAAGPPGTAKAEVKGMFGRDALYISGFALQMISASVVTPILTRVLGPTGFGRVAGAIAIMQVLVGLESVGLQIGIQRARHDEDGAMLARRIVAIHSAMVGLLTVVLYFSAPLWAPSLGFGGHLAIVHETVIWAGVSSIAGVVLGLLRAENRLRAFVITTAFQAVVSQVVGLAAAAAIGGGAHTYLGGVLGVQAVSLVGLVVWVRPVRWPRGPYGAVWRIYRFSLPLIVQSLAVYIYTSSDRLVVNAERGARSVARYQVSYNLAGTGLVLISVLTPVWLSRVLRLNSSDRRRLIIEMRRNLVYLSGIMTLGLAVGAPALLMIWAPPSYRPGGLVVVTVLVSMSTLMYGLFTASYQALVASGATAITAAISLAAGAFNLGGNLVLVHRFGINASAATTLFAYLLLAVLAILIAGRRRLVPGVTLPELVFVVIIIALAAVSSLLGTAGIALAVRWVVGSGCALWLGLELTSITRTGERHLARPVPMRIGAHSPQPERADTGSPLHESPVAGGAVDGGAVDQSSVDGGAVDQSSVDGVAVDGAAVGAGVEPPPPEDVTPPSPLPSATAEAGTVAVVICCYDEIRWDSILRAIATSRDQYPTPDEVVVVVDHNAALESRLVRAVASLSPVPPVRIIANTGQQGLSGARNTGLEATSCEIVCFLDDDARAEEGWLAALVAPIRSGEHVIGAGGWVIPDFETRRPAWFPPTFDWVVGCSYEGLPDDGMQLRNPIGASMAMKRSVALAAGGFSTEVGRVGTRPTGCEETELSIRMTAMTGGIFRHARTSRVHHLVPESRVRVRYFLRRCFAEGQSKAQVSEAVGSTSGLASERRHLSVLGRSVWRDASGRGAGRGGGARATMTLVGFAAASLGYTSGRASNRSGR
jgi:O-antigen/teichoic acid export membrane protein